MQESFYCHIEERYIFKKVYLLVVNDILKALQTYQEGNYQVGFFIRQLAGEDEESWKYYRMVSLLYREKEPLTIEIYRQKLKVLYPDRSSEGYEDIELEFLSYSKHKISREFVLKQLYDNLFKRKEPNIQFMASILEDTGPTLSLIAFQELIIKVLPKVSNLEIEARYSLAEVTYGEDVVPRSRLISIGAYLILHTAFKDDFSPNPRISDRFRLL